jgi:murein DD-endopeptidase MepM/ murein hydrolase activator NlpD
MSNNTNDLLEQTPDEQPSDSPPSFEPKPVSEPSPGRFRQWWENIQEMGIADIVTRAGSHLFTIVMVLVIVFALGKFYVDNVQSNDSNAAISNEQSDNTDPLSSLGGSGGGSVEEVVLPEYIKPDAAYAWGTDGIDRQAEPETVIPSRPRTEVNLYEVQAGDNLFTISEQFGIEPETILWSNYETLKDNPAFLQVGQVLNILPIDGVYYKYNAGESISSIAASFLTNTEKIIEYPGNGFDPYETDPNDPGIPDGTWLIIPDGQRELADWGPPAISRTNPASAAYYGGGHCGDIYEGPIGNGTFVWPTPGTYLSGYHYSPGIHEAIDIGGAEGNAIWATDSGVVVYSGWSEYGYGNLIVIDHGNGWQSAYAHLLYVSVGCGDAVYQGSSIGSLGNTGNSSGAHLHFELRHSSYGRVNPLDYLIQ